MKPSTQSFFTSVLGSFFGSFFGVGFAIFAAMIVIPTLLIVAFSGQRYAVVEPVKDKSILHIDLQGSLEEKRRPMNFNLLGGRSIFDERTVGLYELNEAIDLAKADKRVYGIYLTIRDFNAGWASITSLRRKLQEFTASGKWVYVYAERLNEMGYYLATAASQIFLQPHGDMEFNGLAAQEMFLKGLAEKLDIQPVIFRVGKFKSAVEPFTRDSMSAENREQTLTLIDDIWKEVLSAGAAVAKTEPEQINEIASSLRVASAESAKAEKLVHETAFADLVEDRMRAFTVGKDNDLELVSPSRLLRDSSQKKRGRSKKKIAVIFADGEIRSGGSAPDVIGSTDLREEILNARSDDDVVAIVLRVNSPGGDALASDVIWRELRQSDEELPVVVSMGDVAASGGYYIASAARYVFAEPTTVTGSIGVFGLLFNTEKFFKNKAGIRFDRAVTNPYADMGSSMREMTSHETQVIQGEVDRIYQRFLDVVQQSRGYEEKRDLEAIAEGRVWSGTRARELGLVDELGGLDQAIVKAAEYAEVKDYTVEVLPSETDSLKFWLEKLSEEMRIAIFGGVARKVKAVGEMFDDHQKVKIRARLPFDIEIH